MFHAKKIGIRLAHRILGVVQTEVLGQRTADHQEPAVAVLEIYPVRDAVEQRAQQVTLVRQRHLGAFLQGDIPENSLHPRTSAGLIVGGRLDHVHPGFLPVDRHVFLHRVERLVALHDAEIVLAVFVGEVGRKKIEVGFADDLPPRLAQLLAKPVVGENELAAGILPENFLRQILHQ